MRRRLGGLFLGLLAACGASHGEDPTDGGPRADADGAPADSAPRDAGMPLRDAALDASPRTDAGPPERETWFEDVTSAAGIDFLRTPTDDYETVPDRMSGGVCVIDVDGRSPVDLFFAVRPAVDGTRSRLYVGRELLDYQDATDDRGLGDVGDAMGCLVFDADGDGDDDLLVTQMGGLRLFHNDGGVFVDAGARLGVTLDPRDMYMTAAAGDVDGDGDLDLLVSGFLRFDPARFDEASNCGPTVCTADILAYEYVPDLLLEQQGDGVFRDVAELRAPDLRREEPGLVSAIRDFDGDGRPDLYVGNDIGYSFQDRVLTRGFGGTYSDVALALGLAHDWRGYGIDTMGFAGGDLDGDGRVDFASSSFETDDTAVFVQQEDGTYRDGARELGTPLLARTFRWGVALVDFDLDGDDDLFEATGHFHTDEEIERVGYHLAREQVPNLMVNLGGGSLVPVLPSEEDGRATARSARGIAVTDLDEDGRPDIVLAPALGAPALLRNVRPASGRWLRVRLLGRAPNTDAAGSRVTVRAGSRTYVRERVLGEGYLGSFDARLFFGIAEEGPVEVDVRWPNGATTTAHGVGLDADLTIAEP